MDRARDQLLADAALAENQHRRVGRRRAPHLVHDLRQRRAVADQLVPRLERRPQLTVLAPQRAELDAFAHGIEHVVLRERLLDEAERAEPAGLERGRRGAVRRDHHDRQRLVGAAQPAQHLEAVDAGHLDVEEHEVGRLALGDREAFRAGRRPSSTS